MAVTFAVVFPTGELLNYGILLLFGPIHFLLSDVMTVGSMHVGLSYALPGCMRFSQPWLSR